MTLLQLFCARCRWRKGTSAPWELWQRPELRKAMMFAARGRKVPLPPLRLGRGN